MVYLFNNFMHLWFYAGLDIWKKNMIEPLKESLVKLLLEGIQQDRQGDASFQMTGIIQGVIESFVTVEEYKKKGNLEVRLHLYI